MKKTIAIYGNNQAETLVIMHAVDEEGDQVWEACVKRGCNDFALAVISGVSWEQDMSPWEAPAAFKKGDAFTGGADAYLQELTGMIIPEIFEQMGRRPERIVLAGYSLAGLFALYASYQTDLFWGIVSASGSLWYPRFMDYVKTHNMSESVRKIYFSVGDKEAKTRNMLMQSVEENTRRMAEYVQCQGIEETFELNEGGHFVDDADRLAKGICWMLAQEDKHKPLQHPFPPLFDQDSRILILGSFPSVKSREQKFFYGHKQNRFWKVMARLLECPVPETIEQKRSMLLDHHIAVWDVIASCRIEGSSDSSIRDAVPNDLTSILERAKIVQVFTNGGKAHELYQKYLYPKYGREAVKLPSTSPANAAYSVDRLVDCWHEAMKDYI